MSSSLPDPTLGGPAQSIATAELLAHSAWVSQLARSLVRDAHRAEDLAQETLVEALRSPPAQALNLRGWLATVLRRRASHARRAEARREGRQALLAREAASSIDDSAIQRVERHRELVQHVLALEEVHRTVIVLRFFDGLPPRTIAARLGVPVNTVRSRLQRAQVELRERLEAAHGGREEWIGAFGCLFLPRTGEGLLAASSFGMGMLMNVKSIAALLLLAVGGLWYLSASTTGSVPEAQARDTAASVSRSSPPAAADPSAAAGVQGDSRAVAPAAPTSSTTAVGSEDELVGRLVDTAGRALGGLRVRRHGRFVPRWQGGDLGYVSDGERSRFVSEADLVRLRDDVAFAESFFAELPRADQWRALLLGTACPDREATTAEDGSFRFASAGLDREIEMAEPGWMTLVRGRDDAGTVWVAARRIEVGGRLLNAEWAPLEQGNVVFDWDPARALGALPDSLRRESIWEPNSINAGPGGRYLLRGIPAGLIGASLRVRLPGREDERVVAPQASTEGYDIVCRGGARPGLLNVDGRVVDGAGAPLPEAEVIFARQRVRTDAEGRFAFVEMEAAAGALFTVLARGFAPLQREGLEETARRDPAAVRGLEIVLDVPTRKLRGVVLDREGRGLAGLRVGLHDASLLDFSFQSVEGRLGGWEQGVATDEQGRFELDGLAPRAYRLRAWRPDDGLCLISESLLPGADDVVLRADDATLFQHVEGRVKPGAEGLPEDCAVAVVYTIHVTRSGAGSMSEGSAFLPVGRNGDFILAKVPRRGAFLALRAGGAIQAIVPVESIRPEEPGARGRVEVDLVRRRLLHVLARGELGRSTLTVVDDRDRALEVELSEAGGTRRVRVMENKGGLFAPLVIPQAAVAVQLARDNGTWQRVLIGDDDSGISHVVVGP